MRASGAAININAVARKAKVSRRTIYNNPDLREQIHAHTRTAAPAAADPIEPTVVTALRSQLTAKSDEIRHLKAVVAEKNTTIARLHGHIADLTNTAPGTGTGARSAGRAGRTAPSTPT